MAEHDASDRTESPVLRATRLAWIGALLLALLAVGVLASPPAASAQDPCKCIRRFALDFSHSKRVRAKFSAEAKRLRLPKRGRKRVTKGVYDWADNGALDVGWCKRNPRGCRAAMACLAYAGASMVTSLNAGDRERVAAGKAAVACAAGAAAAWFAP